MHSKCNAALSPSKQTKGKLNFPAIPLLAACQQIFYSPSNISAEQDAILNKIIININEAWNIQTTSQAEDAMWFQERKCQLTASNFG